MRTLVLVAATLIAAPLAAAELAPWDRQFVTQAAHANLAEIQLGRLAVERGADPLVRQYGQKMVDDHTRAQERLRALAERKGVPVPDQPDPTHRIALERLSRLSGRDFDHTYIGRMNADHAAAVTLFETAARHASDAELRAYAQETLPILKMHDHQAERAWELLRQAPPR